MNALSLAVAVRLAGDRIQKLRLLGGALMGAAMAQAVLALAPSKGWTVCLWLPMAAGMMAAARGRTALRHPLKNALLLFCASGLLGGTVLALSAAAGSLLIAYALGAVCMTILAANALRERRDALAVRRARLLCRYRGKEAAFDAIIDSGNTLRDYLTQLPVVVLSEENGRRLLAQDAALRPIFADTAGGRRMMQVFAPQEMELVADGKRQTVRAVIALADGLEHGAPALVPATLICSHDQE